MNFAYVCFVNYNTKYIELMKTTILSVLNFSKYPIIVYCIDFPLFEIQQTSSDNEQLIYRFINDISLSNIHYFKPYVIDDALKQGLQAGYYIESDDVITPFADDFLRSKLPLIFNIPLSPIHITDIMIPEQDMIEGSCIKKTQHYTHGHVLFTKQCSLFIHQWLQLCISTTYSFRNADETVLNIMYWKYNCENHYLPVIDPWYLNFYLLSFDASFKPSTKSICSFHGCKNPIMQYQLYLDMMKVDWKAV